MSHGHHHIKLPSTTVRVLTAVTVGIGVVAVAGMLLLRPDGYVPGDLSRIGVAGPTFDASVEAVEPEPCPGAEDLDDDRFLAPICVTATLLLLEGPEEGQLTTLYLPDSPTTPDLQVGEKLVLAYQDQTDPEFGYAFVDRQRKPVLFALALVFAAAVVVLGRIRGFAALVGLAATVVIVLQFILPAILGGRDPVLVAVVGAAAIAFMALYTAHGLNSMTTVALLGTLASLSLTAVLAHVFVGLAKLSGFTSDEAIIVQLFSGQVDASGLVLAGVVIGALGALDDVTVTQSAAVFEMKSINPSMQAAALYRSGLRIGRDHVAATVNTLVLAYAGAAMPLLIFFVLSEQGLTDVANQEVVATEIVRTLVGSIGLVASVPITTWLASVAAAARGGAAPVDAAVSTDG